MTEPLQPNIDQSSIDFASKSESNRVSSSGQNSNPKSYKTIKLWKEVIIIVGSAVLVFAVGMFIGTKYFWNQFDQTPLLEKQYQSAVEKAKQNPGSAGNHVDLGWALFQKGQYNDALAEYKKATELDDKNYRAYLNLGIAYQQVEKNDLAISTLQKAVELNPKSHEPHYYLGISYRTNGKLDQAVQELELANQIHPGSTQIIYDLAQTYEQTERVSDAKDAYTAALQFDPKFTKAEEALSRLGGNK